jgi:hypothetical protein
MQQPILPSWFKQRQAKAEPAGEGVFKLTAPNLGEAYITIRKAENGLRSAHLLQKPDGPELDSSQAIFANENDAWAAAFELYRLELIV